MTIFKIINNNINLLNKLINNFCIIIKIASVYKRHIILKLCFMGVITSLGIVGKSILFFNNIGSNCVLRPLSFFSSNTQSKIWKVTNYSKFLDKNVSKETIAHVKLLKQRKNLNI